MEINNLPTETLIPYARNPRKNQAAIAKVAASIREFGFRQPIVIDPEMTVIAGHTRLEAARVLGLAEVPVHIATGLTKAQIAAYRLADNRSGQEAEWDMDLLRIELDDLSADIDLSLTGFDDEEIAAILAAATPDGLTDPDDVPDPPAEPVSRLGDVWVMGSHRLVCGDSTDPGVVDKCLNGVVPHLMVTDPPYGVEYDPAWRNIVQPSPDRALGAVANDDKADWSDAFSLFPGSVMYVWHGGLKSGIVADSIASCGFVIRSQIIWAKNQITFGRSQYHWQHEPCWYAVKKNSNANWSSDRKQSTIWNIDKPRKSETGHSTQKPVECMKRPIENNSSPGQAVYEPFSGSGTTIIAAEMTGRSCHAIELNPAYIDVAVKRWQDYTGQVATLDGVPFLEVGNRAA